MIRCSTRPVVGLLREGNWKRAVCWVEAKQAVGLTRIRIHDLRHLAATTWLANGADPKVVQCILRHRDRGDGPLRTPH